MASYRQECSTCCTIWYDTETPYSFCPGCTVLSRENRSGSVAEALQIRYETAMQLADNYEAMARHMQKYVEAIDNKRRLK